ENTEVTDASMPMIAGLTQLEGLRLENTAVTPDALRQLAPLTHLKHLYLPEDLQAEAILALADLPALQPPDLPHRIPLHVVDAATGEGVRAAVRVNAPEIDAYVTATDGAGRLEVRLPEGDLPYLSISARAPGRVPMQASWHVEEGAV